MFPVATTENGSCLAIPDTCNTPAPPGPPVPMPYPNTSLLVQCDPVTCSQKVTIRGMQVALLDTSILMSSGDESGTAGGLVSGINMGASAFATGSSKVMAEGSPVIYLTCTVGHNGTSPNVPIGVHDSPSQSKVFVNM